MIFMDRDRERGRLRFLGKIFLGDLKEDSIKGIPVIVLLWIKVF